MSANIEIEVKSIITLEQYEKVLKHFNVSIKDAKSQTNHYIDTETQQLKKNGISLRVREGDGYIITLKTPLAEGLLEKNQVLSKDEYKQFTKTNRFPEGDVMDFIERLYIESDELLPLASLTTQRIEVNYEGSTLAIDKNEYHGKTDYELEMNANSLNKARDLLESLLSSLRIDFVENVVSKQKRAITQAYISH